MPIIVTCRNLCTNLSFKKTTVKDCFDRVMSEMCGTWQGFEDSAVQEDWSSTMTRRLRNLLAAVVKCDSNDSDWTRQFPWKQAERTAKKRPAAAELDSKDKANFFRLQR